MAESIEEVANQAQDQLDVEHAHDPLIRRMMGVVRAFIQSHRVMCYGGTAINNLLPRKDRFYDPDRDIPDYDFFSETPHEHAMTLADSLHAQGIASVQVKPGIHAGTFKVFGEFIALADITHLPSELFQRLWKESITRDSMHYVPPNFLRMSVYLELSRPRGDVSRWKKVYERLSLLNKEYPMTCPSGAESAEVEMSAQLQRRLTAFCIREAVVLLGMNAVDEQLRRSSRWAFPMDCLVDAAHAERVARSMASVLGDGVRIRAYTEYYELLPAHYDLVRGSTLLVRIFETSACHSYHETADGLFLASIPTLLQFFLAMLYADPHFEETGSHARLLCVAQQLVERAHGNLRRRYKLLTPITCVGTQPTLVDMRRTTAERYTALKQKRSSAEFLEYFFSYSPDTTSPAQKKQLKRAIRSLPESS